LVLFFVNFVVLVLLFKLVELVVLFRLFVLLRLFLLLALFLLLVFVLELFLVCSCEKVEGVGEEGFGDEKVVVGGGS
jgi:hypothetical protein